MGPRPRSAHSGVFETDVAAPVVGASRRGGFKALLLVTELEDYTIAFANGLSTHVSVVLAVPRRRYAHLAGWLDPSVDLRLLDWPRHRSFANIPFLFSLTRLIRAERPDVVHLLSNTTLWLNAAAPFWRPAPLVTTVHDVTVHPGDRDTRVLPNWATNLIVRQSDAAIVHGPALQAAAARRFAKRNEDVHVVAHPAISRYTWRGGAAPAAGKTGRPFTVLFFGRVFAYKGLEDLVRAEALLAGRDLRVIVAGRGDDPFALRDRMGDATRYDIRNRFIPDGEVSDVFDEADVVALPYREASQSGVLAIAAAFGKPAIVTDVGELGGTIEASGAGLVVPPRNPAKLAEAIATLMDDPILRADLGTKARAWADGPISPAVVGAQAARVYRNLVSGAGVMARSAP
mgnify:FL=1